MWRYHGYFALWNDRIPRHRPGGGIGAIGDGDGPLRDTFTNRDINTKRSFIFFYASLPPIPTATSPANFNETLPATPWKFSPPFYGSSPPPPSSLAYSRSHTLLRFTLGFPRTIYAAEPPLAAAENFMTTSCSLYIRDPSNTRHPRIDHVFGRYIYARERLHIPPSPENIERGGQSGLRATAR